MAIKNVLLGAKMVATRGWKKFGKCLLCRTAPQVIVAGYKDQLDRVLVRAGLPESTRLDDIDSADSAIPFSTPEPTFPEVAEAGYAPDAFRAAGDWFDQADADAQVYKIFIYTRYIT